MAGVISEAAWSDVSSLDFRRPSRVSREATVALEVAHEVFARKLSLSWSASSYTPVELEYLGTTQMSLDEYVSESEEETAIAVFDAGFLESNAFLKLELPFSLLLVERLLGGKGDEEKEIRNRRATELDLSLLSHEVFCPAVKAIDESLRELLLRESQMRRVEASPRPLQLGAPSELLLLMRYSVTVRGEGAMKGELSLAYPVVALNPQIEQLIFGAERANTEVSSWVNAPLSGALMEAPIEISVSIGNAQISASRVAGLQQGDILSVGHIFDDPARLMAGSLIIGSGYLGKRKNRVAVQIAEAPWQP